MYIYINRLYIYIYNIHTFILTYLHYIYTHIHIYYVILYIYIYKYIYVYIYIYTDIYDIIITFHNMIKYTRLSKKIDSLVGPGGRLPKKVSFQHCDCYINAKLSNQTLVSFTFSMIETWFRTLPRNLKTWRSGSLALPTSKPQQLRLTDPPQASHKSLQEHSLTTSRGETSTTLVPMCVWNRELWSEYPSKISILFIINVRDNIVSNLEANTNLENIPFSPTFGAYKTPFSLKIRSF